MVMVPRGRCWWWLTTMFQGHPPLPPPLFLSSFSSLSQICTVKLLTLLRPISLRFLSFFLSPRDSDFLLLLLLLVDFRLIPLVDTFHIALIARFFFHGKWAQLVRSMKNARGRQYPTIKTPFLLFQLRIEFNGDATMFESLERIRDGQKFVNTAIYEVTEKLLFLFSFSGPVAQWISRE